MLFCFSDCGNLTDIDNGYISYSSTLYSSVATYTCDRGYYISAGDSVRTCEHGGTWSGQQPTCTLHGEKKLEGMSKNVRNVLLCYHLLGLRYA